MRHKDSYPFEAEHLGYCWLCDSPVIPGEWIITMDDNTLPHADCYERLAFEEKNKQED